MMEFASAAASYFFFSLPLLLPLHATPLNPPSFFFFFFFFKQGAQWLALDL